MQSLEEVLKKYEPVIGLEVHAELTTLNTKMFCGCKLSFGDEPNTHTCPVCLGMPGALPVPNKAAIQSIVMAGLATNCDIEKESMFYRKNYVYPDMAKNFQTTQGPIAFCMRGHLDLDINAKGAVERFGGCGLKPGETLENMTGNDSGYTAHVGITRIHMEEDAGKMVHVGGSDGRIEGATHSLVDYNRAGTPLIELVTEPDLRSPEEARAFMQKLRQIYLAIGISDCSMEKGSLRCDGNISLRRRGEKGLGTKTELKNINSFKSLHDGLMYEILRQAEVLDEGGIIYQETRHYDVTRKHTIVMRVKESADDYRLFPEPDMVPFSLSDEFIEDVRSRLPELPDEKAARFVSSYNLSKADANILIDNSFACNLFEDAISAIDSPSKTYTKSLFNLIVNEVLAIANDASEGDDLLNRLKADNLARLVQICDEGKISKNQQKEVLAEIVNTGKDCAEIIKDKGFEQVTDTGIIEETVNKVLCDNQDKVDAYKAGKTGLIGFFVGECMKALKGQGNPKLINEMLSEKLNN